MKLGEICGLALLLAFASMALAQPPAFTTKDTRGNELTLPNTAKPTLLIFIRPGQSQSEELLPQLAALAKDKELQVVGIVSGDDAAIAATKLANTTKWPGNWPIVTDTDYAASGKFNARVWPTTLLFDKSQAQIAHIAGLPVSFANDLAAYLDLAAGKIDKATLDKRLADRQVVADSADQKAARHVEVAQRLAIKGMRDDARREIASALAYKPKDDAIMLAIVRTHLINHDAKDAQVLLAQITDTGAMGGELNLLKGWSALQQEKWDDARRILSAAVTLNPNPAEAFFLLGKVYDHDNDPKKAADSYRKAFEHSVTGKSMGL